MIRARAWGLVLIRVALGTVVGSLSLADGAWAGRVVDVRVSQLDASTRVVLELDERVPYRSSGGSGRVLFVYVDAEAEAGRIEPSSRHVRKIEITPRSRGGARITLYLRESGPPIRTTELSDPPRIVVDIDDFVQLSPQSLHADERAGGDAASTPSSREEARDGLQEARGGDAERVTGSSQALPPEPESEERSGLSVLLTACALVAVGAVLALGLRARSRRARSAPTSMPTSASGTRSKFRSREEYETWKASGRAARAVAVRRRVGWRPASLAGLGGVAVVVAALPLWVAGSYEPGFAPVGVLEHLDHATRRVSYVLGFERTSPHVVSCLDGSRGCDRALRLEADPAIRSQLLAKLAALSLQAGDAGTSLAHCRRAQELHASPESRECLRASLSQLCTHGTEASDVPLCEEAAELASSRETRARMLFRIGQIWVRAQDADSALVYCERAARLAPQNSKYTGCVEKTRRILELKREEAEIRQRIEERERRLALAPEGCRDCLEYESCDDWGSRPARRLLGEAAAWEKQSECITLALSVCPRFGIECTQRCGVLKKPGCPN